MRRELSGEKQKLLIIDLIGFVLYPTEFELRDPKNTLNDIKGLVIE